MLNAFKKRKKCLILEIRRAHSIISLKHEVIQFNTIFKDSHVNLFFIKTIHFSNKAFFKEKLFDFY